MKARRTKRPPRDPSNPPTRTETIARLRAHANDGVAPKMRWLIANDPHTRFGIRLHFDGYREAYRAAGLRERSRRWSKEKVLDALRRLNRRRRRLTQQHLKATGHHGLVSACDHYFGSLVRARRLAGCPDPSPKHSKKERWDEDRVVDEIRALQRSNKPLAITKVNTRLLDAGIRYCGNWRNAVELAGLDYETIRLNVAWTKRRVIATLRAAVGSPPVLDGGVRQAAKRLFGGLREAASAARLEPDRFGPPPGWTKVTVKAMLRLTAKLLPDLTWVKLRTMSVAVAATRCFGDLRVAVGAAGLRNWPRGRGLTREDVISRLRRRHSEGRSLRWVDVAREDSSLTSAATRRFGSHGAALRAASLPNVQRQKWTRARVREAILDRHRAKRLLTNLPASLRSAAITHFGSWSAALANAGLDYEAIRILRRLERGEILALIRAGVRAGRKGIGPRGVLTRNQAAQARRRFGTLPAAARAAGFEPSRVLARKWRWSESEIGIELRRLARLNPNMGPTAILRIGVGCTAAARFGGIYAAAARFGIRDWPRRIRVPLPGPEEVLAALRLRARANVPLRKLDVDARLVKAAVKHFKTWLRAKRAAGINDSPAARRKTTD